MHTLTRPEQTPLSKQPCFELRFQSLFDPGRGFSFPCDAAGVVDVESLSPQARSNFLRAKARTGVDVAVPYVKTLTAQA